jgi:TetR/AcrR family transcriptional repressor of uid operon
MPKLKPETQAARRAAILDAGELCFARQGFHRTTMQDICGEAGISPGAFYVYFSSKEDLIAGICERDRGEFAERFALLAEAEDVLGALSELAKAYIVEEPEHKRKLFIEIGAEATRNGNIRALLQNVDSYAEDSFASLIERLKCEGRIQPAHEPRDAARLILVIGDGLFWRSAVMPRVPMEDLLPVAIATIGAVLGLRSESTPIKPVHAQASGGRT